MFGLSKLGSKARASLGLVVSLGSTAYFTALTFAGGKVDFEAGDTQVVDTAVGNGLHNLWAGVKFIAPYVGSVAGVVLVIVGLFYLAKMKKAQNSAG